MDLDGDGTFSATETIEYDKIGNPTNYMGATLTWNGRQLTTYTKQGLGTVTYTYDSNGLRTKKTAGGVTTEYYYAGDKLIYEKRSDGNELYFYYNSYGLLSRIEHNGTNYYTATNMSGDVVAIYRHTGVLWATYEYDAWGNVISVKDANGNAITSQTHIANINPIRYRGYYYDTDTELYYLQSRYYNPEIGRFLNADGYITTGQGVLGNNMFAYCGNNPVMFSDSTGRFWESIKENFSKAIESIKVFSTIKEFFKRITTPAKVANAMIETEQRQREHARNVVNTIYNKNSDTVNVKTAPVSNKFEPYEYIELRTGISYSSHIDVIIEEPTIEYLTSITQGRSWEQIEADGDVYEVCHTMIYWDNTMYHHINIYNEGDVAYTYFDALY